jgi:DNA-binding CsgD family transcriptional regulator
MLGVVEAFVDPIRHVRGADDARDVLAEIARAFGYPGAFLSELTDNLENARELIDTDLDRQAAWHELLGRHGFLAGVNTVRQMLAADQVVRLDPARFEPDHPYREFAARWGIGRGVGVPITQADEVAGYVALYGEGELPAGQELALQLLSYQLFAQLRQARVRAAGLPLPLPSRPVLTPREKEVMQLSAVGLTSAEIAGKLGLSARTVNQHVDNVAEKLGTRNRTHTIAELVRYDMLS